MPADRKDAEAVRARPLRWYKPTDHIQDSESAILMAHGIGGRYSIEKDSTGFLLWMAEDGDEFVWKHFPSLQGAKDAAEADWQKAFLSASLKDQPQ